MSARSNTFHLTPAARKQLKHIAAHTQQQWGKQQRDRYLKQLYTRFNQLAAKPQLGKARDEILQGLRSAHEGSHIIYFTVIAGGIAIIGVLHRRMDTALEFE